MLKRTACAGVVFASWLAVLCTISPTFGALSLTSLSHGENFDFLASTGTTNSWTDDQPSRSTSGSPGWWWIGDNFTGYDASDGSSSAPDRTSFGNSTDRAMGSLTGSANDFTIMALVIQNNMGFDLQDLTITFTGEQWRNGADETNTVVFSYRTFDETEVFDQFDFLPTTPDPWTYNSNLNFGEDRGADDVALDGNASANKDTLSDTLVVNIPAGDFIAVRWRDDSLSFQTDHGLAIDDLSITFTPVPEPAAFLFGGLVCGIIGLGYARRKLWKKAGPVEPAA